MLAIAKYKKNNPQCRVYIDSHEDVNNSGTFWFSMFFQYKIFNRILVNLVKKYVDKFFYISEESKDFLKNIYKLSDELLEFYPLGGNIIDDKLRVENALVIRKKYNLELDDFIIVHTGKLDAGKKTLLLLNAFANIEDSRVKLFIIGSIPDDMKDELVPLIEGHPRIIFTGWKRSEEMVQYLCAADLYVQPGTQSATMQNAICCGAPVALFPHRSHEPYVHGNGFFIRNESDCVKAIQMAIAAPSLVTKMKNNSLKLGERVLNYKKLAARLYQ
jgi:glycosyltransferase involved in cell wall biosynthesis